MKTPIRIPLLTLAALAALAGSAAAQDSQYWTQKYGTRALLLSGVAIGTGVDISATFYNPGTLALLDNPDGVLAVKALDFSTVTVDDGAGVGVNLEQSTTGMLPTFFGGTLPFTLFGSSPIAYSLFPRQIGRFDLVGRTISTVDVLPAPGPESFTGEALAAEDLDETWAGLTWSRKLGERGGIGLSQYLAIRSQRGRVQTIAQAMNPDGTSGSGTFIQGFEYTHYRLVTKLGGAIGAGPVDLGLTVTSPSLAVMGSGDAGYDRHLAGVDLDGDAVPDNQLAASFQKDLDAHYKSPVAVGAGFAVAMNRTTVHASAEWFDRVEPYDVLDIQSFTSQVPGQTVSFPLRAEADEVMNWGLGLEHRFGERFTGYLSYATDNASKPEGESAIAISSYDIQLVTAGTTFAYHKYEFTLGVGYAFGNSTARDLADFTDPTQSAGLAGSGTRSDLRYRSFRIIFGFSV